MRYILFVASLVYVHTGIAQSDNPLMKVTDMLKIKTISNITASNNGTAVFVVAGTESNESVFSDQKFVTRLYTTTTNGSAPVQLASLKEGTTQPALSPDGQRLAFVKHVGGTPQIFIWQLSGGEPWQLTKFLQGASTPKWSPDGKKILFSSSISLQTLLTDTDLNPDRSIPAWPYEKPGFSKNEQLRPNRARPDADGSLQEVRAYLQNNESAGKAKVINKLNLQDESNVTGDIFLNNFFITDVLPGARPKKITQGFYQFNDANFTPGGKIVMSGRVDSTRHQDKSLESQIFIADTSGKNFYLFLAKNETIYNSPVVSPSGKWLAFQYSKVGAIDVPKLAIVPLNGDSKDIINIPFDRGINNITWSGDEYFYFTATSNGGAPLFRANISAKKVEQLSDFNSGITSFALAGNKIIYSKTEVANPSELYIAESDMKDAKRISNFNDWVKNKKLSFPEKHSFVNNKSMTVDYWVMKPANYQRGKKYPLLLEIHGGPAGMWGPGEASMWHEFQFFCSRGYGVVYCNPRGSGGYGENFLRGNIKDWGTGPASDVLTALDKTVAESWADDSKLLITGGSYGGYLVAWIISHDRRFTAACSQRGLYDLSTFFGEGNAWRLVPDYFGGYPWEAAIRPILQIQSPINYVQNIITPYIIFHGEADRRTGFVEGEMLYKSLKVLGRPVEYVRHPNATHEITRSGDNRQRIDQMLRTYEFFERWLNKK